MKLGADSLADLSVGAVFLATGGGGDPHVSFLIARQVLEELGPVELLDPEELNDDAYVVAIGGVGAPTVSLELLPSRADAVQTLEAFESHVGRKVDAVVSFEIGGGNSLIPLVAAAERGLPVVDGDGMGRALPEAQMMTYPISGVLPTPAVGRDYAGNIVTFSTPSILEYERQVRRFALENGGMITAAEHPMNGRQLKESVVSRTVTFSVEIGKILNRYRGNAEQIFEPLSQSFAGSIYGDLKQLYAGKVIDSSSKIIGGFDIGEATIESFDKSAPPMTINIKNEYLMARIGGRVAASVPDLITIVDHETSMPINAERMRYGQRVTVFGVGCPACYRTANALAVVEPRCFGFDIDYVPIEKLARHSGWSKS
ncbi:MAG: DUF917 domain-containing protein [Woeseia sp.]